jgi:hypothetical protein
MANNLIDKDGKLNTKEYNKKVKKQQETFAKIDATMAILEKMPELADVGLDFLNSDSFTLAANPLEYLFNILKALGVSEDKLKEWITEILTVALPAIEVGVKASLLANIKSIISCDFDPRIPWYLRKAVSDSVYEDVVHIGEGGSFYERGYDISLNSIDPEGMLDLSPFTEPGEKYYFGQSEDVNEDSCSKIAKLARADDFNAFLWYVVHKGNRQNPIAVELDANNQFTYNGKTYTLDSPTFKGVCNMICDDGDEFIEGTTFCDKNDPKEILICIEKTPGNNRLVPISSDWKSCNWYVDKNNYYKNNIVNKEGYERNYANEKPICNLAYTDLADYKGSSVKVPYDINNLRFTILPKPAVILPTSYKVNYLNDSDTKTSWRVVRLLFDADGTPNNKGKYSLEGVPKMDASTGTADNVEYDCNGVRINFSTKTGKYSLKNDSDVSKLIECYPGLTIYEFNYDYIMGMKLFDTKTVCNKVLASATNSKYTANFSLTINKQKIKANYPLISAKQRVTEIVRKILESDEEEYNDCFYTFSNDEYAELLRKTEELRYHQSPYTEGYGDGQVVDLSDAERILADYPVNGTLEEQKDVVNRAIEAACATLEDTLLPEYQSKKSSVKLNFLTNIFQQLALCLVDCIMSPKVLMLIEINDMLMNDYDDVEYPLTTEHLVQLAKNLITSLIKELRDLIMQKILDYIIEFLTPMILELQAFIASEQFAAYLAIIKLLLGWFNKGLITATRLNAILSSILSKFKSGNYDDENYEIPSILDDINYADIYESDLPQSEPIINNC